MGPPPLNYDVQLARNWPGPHPWADPTHSPMPASTQIPPGRRKLRFLRDRAREKPTRTERRILQRWGNHRSPLWVGPSTIRRLLCSLSPQPSHRQSLPVGIDGELNRRARRRGRDIRPGHSSLL